MRLVKSLARWEALSCLKRIHDIFWQIDSNSRQFDIQTSYRGWGKTVHHDISS